MTENRIDTPLKQKLHLETAPISWRELQRFFAQGLVRVVDSNCDLIEVAAYFVEDRAQILEAMLADGLISLPGNDQARQWYSADSKLWSVVVAPFVLVQEQK